MGNVAYAGAKERMAVPWLGLTASHYQGMP
jgi:hypothetical protein